MSSFKAISLVFTLLFLVKVMHSFKCHKNIISNEVVRHEGTLVFTNNVREETFEPFAKTFVASLEIIMLRLIGLYYVVSVGFFIFGMRIMWVSLNFGGLMPRFK